MEGEDWSGYQNTGKIDFSNSPLSHFSLKYLAKFVFEHHVESLAVNGAKMNGYMPLLAIKNNQLQQLVLSECGLHTEDLFVLSQFLKHNSSITKINLSK